MGQFDIHRLPGGVLVVDLQTDLIGLDATRIVAPLREEGTYTRFPGLTPIAEFEGRRWIVRLQELAAVTATELGTSLGSVRHLRDELKRGLDILIDGF
jgi:toxin CcdB